MKKLMIALAFAGMGAVAANAQTQIETPSKYTVATNSFWSNWYVQVGVDMSLQNPYGSNFGDDVFPNGKSFGVNVAVGKWFTPGLGLRTKVQWENGILENKHANWFGNMTPTGAVGENGNYDAGGYGAIYGDVQFNLSNLFCGYNETRVWNVIVYPRAGVIRNFERNNYYPVLGAGLENTWRINKLLSIYVDAAYNWVTKGHINNPVVPETRNGLSNNGYVDLNLGLQFNLGKSTFSKAVTIDQYNALAAASEEAIAKLRADLDRERQINADLRAQLAKAPKGNTVVSNNVVAGATSVFFDINSSKINSQKDLINLESIATSAKNSKAKVVVTGAADSKTGSDAYNQKLSEARAQAVADELVNLGVSRDNIEVKSVGGVNDVTPYNLNRRAIIELK